MSSSNSSRYLEIAPWTITEIGFHPDRSAVSESIFSLANEFMGVRGFFEEGYGGETLVGSYFNGLFDEHPIAYPVLSKGFPTRTHFMANSVNWLYTRVIADGETLDLKTSRIADFERSLDLRTGVMTRSFVWTTAKGHRLQLCFTRFLSMVETRLGCQRIAVSSVDFQGSIRVELGLDFSPVHVSEGKNLWKVLKKGGQAILGETSQSGQKVLATFHYKCAPAAATTRPLPDSEKLAGVSLDFRLKKGEPLVIDRLAANQVEKRKTVSGDTFWKRGTKIAKKLLTATFDKELARNTVYWAKFWEDFDISIEGDPSYEQGTRYCLFQLHSTYHGVDPHLNIGAKGLTGEAYGGLAFWDTETYCLPFYLFTDPKAARNLLMFRYNTLPEARERARQLHCEGARYPMTTIDGTEACVVWYHGDLEIHVPAAVAYGVWHYVRVTNDQEFLHLYGAEMLIEISRFYASHGNWSPKSGEFGMWGVMGADEFHLMVHNNAYTNTMAKKTFEWALEAATKTKRTNPAAWTEIVRKTGVTSKELAAWRRMAAKMRLQRDAATGLIEQHDGYFDLPPADPKALKAGKMSICKTLPYISRSRFDWIKQPDVLLLPFFFSKDYSIEEKRVNYAFYEPRCAHESSLSPGVHSILAAELGLLDKAFDYVRYASRLDLDDFNGNTNQGLHMTSMAAAWMSFVYGFGGMRSDGKHLSFEPSIPDAWKSFSFRVLYRQSLIEVTVTRTEACFQVVRGTAATIEVFGKRVDLGSTREGFALPKLKGKAAFPRKQAHRPRDLTVV